MLFRPEAGGWLGGDAILPERLWAHRDKYVQALKKADEAGNAETPDLTLLRDLISRLLSEQFSEIQ